MGKWEMVRLSEAADFNMGQSPSSESYNDEGQGVPFFQGKTDFGLMYPTVRMYCTDPKKIAEKDDILISVRAPVGAVNIATGTCCIGRGLAAISQKNGTSDYKYLYYFLKYKENDIANMGVGSTFKAISKKDLDAIEIPFPPLPVQRQIADVLDRVSALIEKRKAQIDKLDLLMKSQFIEMFGDPVTNPKEWEVVAIGDIETKIRSGLSRKLSNDDIGVPVIRSTNMINGYMDTSDIKYWYINDPQGADVPSYFLKSGDILVNFINSNEHIGKVCIYFDIGRECIYTTNIFVMNLNDKCNSIWFNQYAKTDAYKYQLRNIIQPAVNQSSFTTANYRKLKIPLPPISIQNEFADFVRQVETQISLLQQSLAKLEQNYKSLMQKCFRGEIF